jgi:dienelactone hydrolase
MLRRSFSLINSSEELIRGDIRHLEHVKDAPVIVICHGFKGFKDWGFFPSLAENIAEAGYIALSFNFSRNGLGPDPLNFTRLDLFAKNTFTHELADLNFILEAVRERKIGKGLIDSERIGLLGHSRGGGIVLLQTATDKKIQALVTWGAIAYVDRFSKEQVNGWKKDGFIEIENKRTQQLMRLDIDLLNDITKNKKKLNILDAAKTIEAPTLILHGEQDDSVPVNESQQIFDHLKTDIKEIHFIENSNHTFGISHPMQSQSAQFGTVLDLTENWFDRYLTI